MSLNVLWRFFFFLLLLTTCMVYGQAPPNCLSVVPGTLQCQICVSTFMLDDQGNCRFYTPIEGCQIYNSSSTQAGCVSCSTGYMVSAGVCLSMLPNCVQARDAATCDKCAQGYTLVRSQHCYSLTSGQCKQGSLPRISTATSTGQA